MYAHPSQIVAVAQALFERTCERALARGHEPHHKPGTRVSDMPPSYQDDYLADARAALAAMKPTYAFRGGPGHDYPCSNPNMIECAGDECQRLGRCKLNSKSEAA